MRVDVEQHRIYQRLAQPTLSSRRPANLSRRILALPGDRHNKQQPLPSAKQTLSDLIGGGHLMPSRPAAEGAFRGFPSAPERVLDAPGIVDDFYLNVLDWSKRNVLAVALGPSVYLWHGRTGDVTELLSLPQESTSATEDYVASLRWIHDGTALAIGTSHGLVQIWDAEAGKKIRTILASSGGHRLASLAWNRHLLSTGARDGAVCTHDVRQARPLLLAHEGISLGAEVCGMEWSPDGSHLAVGSNANLVQVWEGLEPAPRHVFAEHRAAVKALAWCPWRQGLLATGGGSQDKSIRCWNTLTGALLHTTVTDAPVNGLVWSRTSRELVSIHGQPTNAVRVWRASSSCASACQLAKAAGLDAAHSGRILHTSLSPDGQTLVTASAADEFIKFWRAFSDDDGKQDPGAGSGKPKKGSGGGGGDRDYVLMPRFSRSAAVGRALNAGNRLVS